jgi:tartrate dehydrogenase/decarboxylase/D-malate dehydrogenase
MKRIHRIATIPGDGVGNEVVSEGIKCLKALSEITEDVQLEFEYFPWSSEYYLLIRSMALLLILLEKL